MRRRRSWMAECAVLSVCCILTLLARAQQSEVPDFIQQAQTIEIPVFAVNPQIAQPFAGLMHADVRLKVNQIDQSFHFSSASNSSSGIARQAVSLLLVVPPAAPVSRKVVLEEAARALEQHPLTGWSFSILNEAGEQTAYSVDQNATVAALRSLENRAPEEVNLEDWRTTASLAISSMRHLPGRRIVVSLGDIFHEQIEGEWNNFAIQDVAQAARDAGVLVYAADSASEVKELQKLTPTYDITGAGPWLLRDQNNQMAGWITGSVADTLNQIQRDTAGEYLLSWHLDAKQMDGQMHIISLTAPRANALLNVPAYFIAPDMARLQLLSRISPVLRQALLNAVPSETGPLQVAVQVAYFPHPDGKTGTQWVTAGFFWNAQTPPPAHLATGLQLEQGDSGFIRDTTIGSVNWRMPVWSAQLSVSPGVYRLRVAAADDTGKVSTSQDSWFTVESENGEQVLLSSVVLGKTCAFSPPGTPLVNVSSIDYLQAGNCRIQPDPTLIFSPQDVIWTLVRMTPIGSLANRPAKDWKGNFILVDAQGDRVASQPVRWLQAESGSYVATTAFPLDNPHLKLRNGAYAVVFQLKGPGLAQDYQQEMPLTVQGAEASSR